MACSAGPNIVEDGLVLALDAGNSEKSYKTDNNLLDPSTWYVGANSTSGVTGFSFNETDSGENTLISDTDPFGNTAVIWKAQSPDGVNDGGWNTDHIDVDHTKLYRFSVWVNRKVTGTDGRFYFGVYGYNSSNSHVGVLFRVNGNNNTNPYFVVSGNGTDSAATVPEDEWVLVVAHVWPSGSGTGSNKDDTGVWKTDGTKLTGTDTFYDYVWNTTVTKTQHRTYLFYSENDATVIQHWAYPRIDLVDGTEPSIDDLINNRVNDRYVYDICGQNNHGTLMNGVSHSSANNGYFDFDGSDDFIGFDYDLRSNWTYECWVNKDSKDNFSFLGQGITSARNGLHINMYDDKLRFGMYNNDTDANGLYSNTSTGIWYHYAFSYNHSTYVKKIYRNGVSLSVTPIQTQTAYEGTGIVRIGAQYSSGSTYANGKISNSKLYNRVLTDAEIKQNFNALRGRFGI